MLYYFISSELVVAGTGDLPITGADLNVPGVAVRGAAVLDSIRLGPDVTVVTEVSPGAGLSVGLVGGVLPPSITHHRHGPVRLPGVSPVPAYQNSKRNDQIRLQRAETEI